MKKWAMIAFSLGLIGLIGSVFEVGNIMLIMENNGYHIPKWAAEALTTIGGVYSAQHYLIGVLGVSVPLWLAGAVVAAGAVGV